MEIENKINEMLKENTGIHFLDSGMDNNRGWQKNKDKDFSKEKILTIDASFNDIEFSLSTYHYLTSFLEINDKSEKYNKMFYAGMDKDTHYLAEMELFADLFINQGTTNTYNFENILSQVLQYTIFKDNDDDMFIILQIHGGCDVRGGYTNPYIFSLPDFDYFCMAITNLNCFDKKGNGWYSDDTGFNWYPNNKEHELEFKFKDNKVYDKKTGNLLDFSVNLDY